MDSRSSSTSTTSGQVVCCYSRNASRQTAWPSQPFYQFQTFKIALQKIGPERPMPANQFTLLACVVVHSQLASSALQSHGVSPTSTSYERRTSGELCRNRAGSRKPILPCDARHGSTRSYAPRLVEARQLNGLRKKES